MTAPIRSLFTVSAAAKGLASQLVRHKLQNKTIAQSNAARGLLTQQTRRTIDDNRCLSYGDRKMFIGRQFHQSAC
jgi:hypothetical protein